MRFLLNGFVIVSLFSPFTGYSFMLMLHHGAEMNALALPVTELMIFMALLLFPVLALKQLRLIRLASRPPHLLE